MQIKRDMGRLVTRQTTKNYNQLFSDRLILNRVLTKQALIEYLTSQDDKINRMPTDTEVRAGFHESTLTNKYAADVLCLIESKVRDQSRYSTQLLGLSKYSLEHLMPKKWHNHWTLDDTSITSDERDRNLLTLGNLTMITQSLNASIRDADWNTKNLVRATTAVLTNMLMGLKYFLNIWKSQFGTNPQSQKEQTILQIRPSRFGASTALLHKTLRSVLDMQNLLR